jgi:cell division protein FtsN
VRVGPYPSHEAAVAARDKLKSEGQSGIVAAIK